ncbi:MAG: UDP-glucose 4-epimerase GalE [Chloroflexi bacterium]|nr:UDP-glucose 4-epimerase GalE [Chloroflexota bacterium]
MRVLVTGGAGYVGSVSVEALVAAGHSVVVLDDCSTGHAGAIPPGIVHLRQDYTDEAAMTAALREHDIDTILHCAARSLVGESMRDPARYYRQNVAGGIALLDAARAANVRRFVFSSTAAVYGIPLTTPIDEDAPLRPINPYGETKRTFEGALDWYSRAYGLRAVSLRYFNVAGATEANGEDHDPETHLIPAILRAAETSGELTMYGDDYPTPDGTPIRDYIDVRDLAAAHLLALEATADAPSAAVTPGLLACNLGVGDGFSVRQVIAATERVVGRSIPVRVGPRREGDPPVLVARADRARDTLGWRPRHDSLEEMIGSAWAWRRRHPDGYGDRTGGR